MKAMKKILSTATLGIVAVAFCACSSIRPNQFEKGFLANHVITVSERGVADVLVDGVYQHDRVKRRQPKQGSYNPTNQQQLKLDFPGPRQKQFEAELTNLFDNIARRAPVVNGRTQILIFAHGGLNTERARLERIRDLIGTHEGDESSKIRNYYPVFINWESGLLSSYGEHVSSVRAGRKYEPRSAFGWPLIPIMFVADFGKSIAKTPGVWAAQLTTDVKAGGYRNSDEWNSDRLYEQWRLASNSISVQRGSNQCTSGWIVARDVTSYAATLPVKLVSAPFIDGLGESAWKNMYRRTETMFHSVYEFDISWGNRGRLGGAAKALEERSTGATAQFLEGLKKRFGTNGYEITLVAHSAGAIVMNKVLQRFPDLPYRRITYMAAACPISELEGSLIPVMKRNTNVVFTNLCLNPRSELNEANAFDLAPRGSLLEWIDNFLGNPRTASDRTLGKWENIMQSAHIFPAEIRPRISMIAAKYQPGCTRCGNCDECENVECDPQKHGDFGGAKFWERSKKPGAKMKAL